MRYPHLVAAATIAVAASSLLQPALAQYPGANRQDNSGYTNQRDTGRFEQGYRAGYEDARANRRYDDRADADDRGPNRSDLRAGNRFGGDRAQLWQQRYARVYTYRDYSYYQQCSRSADPAGVIAAGLIGGLVANTAVRGNARAGALFAAHGGKSQEQRRAGFQIRWQEIVPCCCAGRIPACGCGPAKPDHIQRMR